MSISLHLVALGYYTFETYIQLTRRHPGQVLEILEGLYPLLFMNRKSKEAVSFGSYYCPLQVRSSGVIQKDSDISYPLLGVVCGWEDTSNPELQP